MTPEQLLLPYHVDADPFLIAVTSDALGVIKSLTQSEALDLIDKTDKHYVTTTVSRTPDSLSQPDSVPIELVFSE